MYAVTGPLCALVKLLDFDEFAAFKRRKPRPNPGVSIKDGGPRLGVVSVEGKRRAT